jgi:hypothetical protein
MDMYIAPMVDGFVPIVYQQVEFRISAGFFKVLLPGYWSWLPSFECGISRTIVFTNLWVRRYIAKKPWQRAVSGLWMLLGSLYKADM